MPVRFRTARRWSAAFVAAAVSLSSAALGQPASAPIAAPQAFQEPDLQWAPAYPAEAQPRGDWWEVFADPELTRLCGRSAAGNGKIEVAAARLKQARALAAETRAASLPQLDGSVSASQASGPLINAAGGQGRLLDAGASLSYELDLFHRISDTRKAAALDVAASEGLVQSTRLLVEAEVAQTYFEIRSLDQARDLTRRTLAAYQQAFELISGRFQSGSVTELDVERARFEVASAQSDVLTLDELRSAREHALAVLVGDPPSEFRLAEAAGSAAVPAIPAGLPATLVSRRPDISAAQANLAAAQLRLGIARRAWLPSISLTASGGYASPSLADLLSASAQSWTAGLMLATPLLDGGRRKARIAWSDAEVSAQVALYRDAVLVSFKEVEDQLLALRILAERRRLQTVEVASAARALTLAQSRFDRGLASQLEVIEAQRNTFKAQRAEQEVEARRLQATVGLVRALGGGWDAAPVKLARS